MTAEPGPDVDDEPAEPEADDAVGGGARLGDDDAPVAAGLDLSDLGPWWAPPPGVDLGLTAHLGPDGAPIIIERRFTVTEDFVGHRLDHYLKRMIPRLSRTKLQRVIAEQLVRVDGRAARSSSSVAVGDELILRRPARAEPPCPRTFTVLHKDAEVMVVDKPAGLPVHASAKFYFNTLTRVVAERFPDEDWQICHRLDRETSGTLVLARGRAAAAALKGSFERKRAAKTYLAIVHGDPPWPDGTDDADGADDVALDFGLRLSQPGDPTLLPHVRMLVDDGPGALPSMTRVRVVERVPGYALVRCRLITGRQHQIRAHLAHAGFPIVGDKLYGHGDRVFMTFCDRGLTRELALRFELPRHALHATRIRIPHPSSPSPVDVTAPLAWDLAAFLAAHRAGA